jgi:hypothetical protein
MVRTGQHMKQTGKRACSAVSINRDLEVLLSP